ncbi:Cro/CI family transcriptional regulator [Streptococcus pneumoniae]|nr:helix-turn-helix transcriptional regulator [Streptococcus pneumoniae]MBT1060499.1 helix-turn-helix domain-containing protein [Streptococcus pneumoniae]CEO75859.1 Cro/CI family transcriptional regulator [Streptococcus pneumoniae]CEW44831.1 Cro/CI family transcriptional regulator [Streptococcus pneumoniae]CGE93403.1 Cro/CI family transcriptional regulator [Streptococcus pneumoniae]CGF36274.1 Cro/CI family transcriptional regulator [Streptococcus pneumoniae]
MYRRLRDLREDLDIFQSEIADFLHCTQSAYSKIE